MRHIRTRSDGLPPTPRASADFEAALKEEPGNAAVRAELDALATATQPAEPKPRVVGDAQTKIVSYVARMSDAMKVDGLERIISRSAECHKE